MKKSNKMLKKQNKEMRINLKLTEAEFRKISAMAKWFTQGNISRWLRYAGMNCNPNEKDLG